ncbi:MAG: hypothetical protein IGQ45_01810 [Cyanobacterium sp. T60_A2020_053]|nr:hypothetical protein [Cyanobacterium sp. T60_A2020_053]
MNQPPNPNPKLDWYGIACKIRAKYEAQQQKLTDLEQSLVGYQKELVKKDTQIQEQKNIIISKQSSLKNAQIKLNQQKSVYEKQQLLLEKLTLELQESQHQRAKLERECSSLQDRFCQKEYELKEKDQENKQLQVRLQRQQRSTLEYKSTLDKVLENKNSEKLPLPSSSPQIESWGKSSLNEVQSKKNDDLANKDSDTFEAKKEILNPTKIENENLVNKQEKTIYEPQLKPNISPSLEDLAIKKPSENSSQEAVKKDVELSSEKNPKGDKKKKGLIQLPNFLK